MKPLHIREVTFTNFKNYPSARFHLGPKFNLVHGLNGTGKTNLLDGVYYLCVGKSYFTPFDHKVVTVGQSFFRLEGNMKKEDTSHSVIIKVIPGEKKELIVDGVTLDRISDHLGFLPIVISAPRDIELVQGSGQFRRKYMDHLLCQVDRDYLQSLMAYNHLLQMRNATLKNEAKDLRRLIETIDEQMHPHAQIIFERRRWLAEHFIKSLPEHYDQLADHREQVSVAYESGLHQYSYDRLVDMHWESDRNTKRSHAGIHKDDFSLLIKGMTARDFGSQGQIKSLIFAMHLSKYKILAEKSGFKPVLILDDIFDKLDETRLSRLMEILMADEFGQILLSDTSNKRVNHRVGHDQLHEIKMEAG